MYKKDLVHDSVQAISVAENGLSASAAILKLSSVLRILSAAIVALEFLANDVQELRGTILSLKNVQDLKTTLRRTRHQ